MNIEQCIKCEHFSFGVCKRSSKLVSKIRGCAHSPSGKKFFRASSGKEAFRLKVLGKNKGEQSK